MIIELLGISIPYGKMQEFGRAVSSLARLIQVQPGCSSCRIFQEWATEDILQMETRWQSEGDLIRHLQSDVYKKILLLMELSALPPVLEFLTVVELRGLEVVESSRTSPN